MKIHIWMAMDPQTCRVFAQTWEFDENSFPAGPRGAGWPTRETEVDDADWAAMLRADLSPAEQDDLHRRWWDSARADTRDPFWPELPT